MREPYDPNLMTNVYFNMIQNCQRHLAAVDEPCLDNTIIRHALTQFELQSDLVDAVDKWKELPEADRTTWKQFKTHFGKEIKKIKRGQGTLKQVGIANAVHEQVATNQVLAENILAHQQEMEILRQELTHLKATATAATAPQANAVVTAIPSAPVPPANQHDQLLQQMQKMIDNLKTTTPTTTRRDRVRIPDNDKNGVRQKRRYEHNNYCWTCGYDINHTSATCKWIKDTANHKATATFDNLMGGSTRNLHLKPTWYSGRTMPENENSKKNLK